MKRDMIDALLDSAKVIGAMLLIFILLQVAGACATATRCPSYGQQQYSRH